MNDETSSNNPIYNKSMPLDCNLIGDILASFLRADPAEDPFFLPTFRIETCCDRVSGKIIMDGNLLEGVGALYCLCMYFASVPKINVANRAELKALLIMEACMGECLALLQESDKLAIAHPMTQYDKFTDTVQKYETFEHCYDVAKEIIREILKPVRSAGDKLDERTKHSRKNARGVKDCFQLHSIYYMCVLGLSHACGVFIHYDIVYKCPGLVESLLLGLTMTTMTARSDDERVGTAPSSSKAARDNHMRRQMKSMEKKSDSDRFQEVFDLVPKMCFAIVSGLKLDDIKRINLVKIRLVREVATSLVDFAQMSARTMEVVLKKEESPTATGIKRPYIDANCILLAGQRVPLKMKIPPKTDEDHHGELPTALVSPSKNDKDDGRLDARGPLVTNHLKKSVKPFWNVVERLRPVYLCFMRLRQPQVAYFAAKDISPSALAQMRGGDQELSPNQRLDVIESYYKDMASLFIPRVCDPADGMFWGGQLMLDYVISQAKKGAFICQENEATKANLSKGINAAREENAKRSIQMTKAEWKEKQDGYKTMADPTARRKPPSRSAGPGPTFALLADGGIIQRPDSSVSKVVVKKDLIDRLRSVELEAKYERDLSSIFSTDKTKKTRKKVETRLRKIDARLASGLEVVEQTSRHFAGTDKPGRGRHTGTKKNTEQTSSGVTLDQTTLDVQEISRFRKLLRGTGVTAKVAPKYTGISAVWTRPEEPPKENPLQDFLPPKEVDHDNLFKHITGEMRKDYAKSINKYQSEREKKEAKMLLKMEESKQLELDKMRTFKLGSLRAAMDERRQIEKDSMRIKVELAEAYESEGKAAQAQERVERRIRQQRDERENERIKDFRKQKQLLEAKENRRAVEREHMETIRLAEIKDSKETQEVIRRAKEEARMMLLETRQRQKEDLREAAIKEKAVRLKGARENFKKDVVDTRKHIRHGSFHRLKGKGYSFYKGVRAKDKPYIQYDPEDGPTYYYDTIDGTSIYRKPSDAPIIHSDNLAMEEYELEHGEGSWAALLADRAWKDQVNVDKGYYDEEGNWIDVQGYYDENYEWVDLSHGYFDDDGEFHEYANGIGTLDFMV